MSACVNSPLVVAVIPARFQSTRFPGKPLASILGKPLIQWTIENTRRCNAIHKIIIATDDDRIEKVVRNLGVDVHRTDPTCASGTDRIAQVVQERPSLKEATFLVNIQGDEPCIQTECVDAVLDAMQQSHADIGTPISPIYNEESIKSPHITKCVRRLDNTALYFSRSPIPGAKKLQFSQNTPYYRHIGLYVFRPKSLITFSQLPKAPLEIREDLEMLRALEHGMTIITTEVNHVPPGVDIPEDILKVERWIQRHNTSL